MMLRTLLLLTACLTLSACLGRAAIGTAGTVTGAAVRTTGNVVGGAVEVVTQGPHQPTDLSSIRPELKGMLQ